MTTLNANVTCTLQITPHLDQYPNADLVWCQEEPLNNGAWTYVQPRLITALNESEHHKGKVPSYVFSGDRKQGRP
jgi:2-oxoglutarate dehydrogenase complex dehydrogenase (E1) component-like enzyme